MKYLHPTYSSDLSSNCSAAYSRFHIGILLMWFCWGQSMHAQQSPRLILTQKGVHHIRTHLGQVPLFDQQIKRTQAEVDAEIAAGIDVPIPKDMSGGYTHERHKKNFFMLQKAGNLFQITQDETYAIYIRDMFLEYAKLYPTLELHPTNRSYATGKIFWQCLNDANWLVYASQAYDCIYDWLQPEERALLEKDLFRPFADFLSVDNPQFFNRIHNHSTWGNAAVGMIGLVMNDSILINRALHGLKQDGIDANERDNDDGFIKQPGQKSAGFLAQLDFSFSPDGYFTEGPYYLRYAMSPFLLFGKALANNRPDLDIFAYRDSILLKAVYALLYQADSRGLFFPLNDSQKGMSWEAREVITAVDFAYQERKNPELLSIAEKQGKVQLDDAGFAVAQDLAKGLARPFRQPSIEFRDGPNGDKGGVGILRSSTSDREEVCLVMKYSAQGMGHGHFDKLSYSLYNETGEIIQDYGAARWVNIDQKGGGRYLKENNTWAKQSIAHNTLVINETSHYEGDVEKGEANQSERYAFSSEHAHIQIVSAKDVHAYPGVALHRTMAMLTDSSFPYPIIIDVFRVDSENENQYDLPTWFQGHLMSTDLDYDPQTTSLRPLGTGQGYQHIWTEAVGQPSGAQTQLTWFGNEKFYTTTMATQQGDEVILGRAGANDPDFNLRHDPCFILRRKASTHTVFVSVIEPHGDYDYVSEIPIQPFSNIASLDLLYDEPAYTAVSLENHSGQSWTLILANEDKLKATSHQISINQQDINWTGPYHLLQFTNNQKK